MTLQIQLIAAPLDQKRDMARHEPMLAMADQQTEIVALDMRDQNFGAGFGKNGRQVNHAASQRSEHSRGMVYHIPDCHDGCSAENQRAVVPRVLFGDHHI